MSLGRKQASTHEDWVRTMANIESIVPKAHIQRLAKQAVADVLRKTAGKKVAYAWSGGKDSIALQGIMELAGIKNCVLGMCDLEYPAFLQWVTDNMPDGLEIVNTGQNLQWLAKNQHMLFPQDAATAGKWFKMVQHTAQERYYKKHKLDMIILGRRKADGNYVGKDNIYTNAQGITRYSPIADWSHEELLAFIHYTNMPLPPFYSWPRGYRCGTHNIASRQWCESVEHGWSEVYTIDPNVVREAAKYIESAREYLAKVEG